MGIFDWLGPINAGKRAPWELGSPSTTARTVIDTRSLPLGAPNYALTLQTLAFMPGFNPAQAVDVGANSAVIACLSAISAAIAEPDLKVYTISTGDRIEADETDLGRLLARPNPHFTMDTLLSYLAACLHVDGNAYWRKLRAGDAETGPVIELWPIAPSCIAVQTDSATSDFITSYRYTYGPGKYVDLGPEQIVHFRYGLDGLDHRIGWSPLKSLVREVSTDQMATRYAERLLGNLAINGLSLTFDKESPPIDQATADELKARIKEAYGGDNVGAAAVLSPGAQLTALGFSPEQMDLSTQHRVPEERICAVLGVPAAMVGLGVGLEHSIYNNVKQAEEHFTERKLLPLWAMIAADITLQLVPDFGDIERMVVDFDTTTVRALADDQDALALRLKTLVETGILDLDEARAELGMEPRATQPSPSAGTASRLDRISRRTLVQRLMVANKAADDLIGDFHAHRERELPDWEHELTTFLDRQRARVTRRLHAGADTADELVTEGEAVLLGETLTPLQMRVLNEVARLVEAELGVAFGLDDPATREYLRVAGQHIVGITETTRTAVQTALIEGQMAGEGIEDLARRLRDLPAFGSARGRVVARTELGHSTSTASLASYRASGVVVGVRVYDGDYDAACAAMNGRVFALDQAPPTLQHPQCTRAFGPLTDTAELTRSA